MKLVSKIFLKSTQFLILLSLIACVPDEVTIKLKKISDLEGASITLDAIANQTVVVGVAISPINAGEAGIDFSVNGDALTYTCFYDTNLDGSVASTNACSSLSGINFSSSTGEMSWTPSGAQVGSYEFKIVATDGRASGERLFTITVNASSTPPTNQAPVLDAIFNQTVNEGVAITTIDAGDGGDDFDSDGDALTYSCYYDTTVDGSVASTTNCTALSGMIFSSTTGVMNWMPDLSQSGNYEFKIIATDGSLSDEKIFSITVNNVNTTPVLDAIANQTVAENVAITTINAGDGGDDFDADGDALTYSCYYDTTVDGTVANTTACTSLTGLSFSTTTGVMSWTPNYSQAGSYEFKMRATDGSAVGERIFTITVTNVNRAPSLTTISNQTVSEGSAITSINADDGGDDFDVDGDALTYTCYYDTTVDGAVASTSSCSSLSGATFSATTGTLSWTTSSGQAGNYEFKISASDGSLSDSKIFSIQVNASVTSAAFVTKWRTTASNESITLPLNSTGTYNFVVDWGDGNTGTVTSYSSGAKTHTYASAGTYTVSITGTMSAIYTNSSEPSRTKLIEVVSLGSTQLTDLTNAFYSCSGLMNFSVGGGDTSLVTSTSAMFFNTRMTSLNVTGLNTSNVTNMSRMFASMINLTSLNLTGLDTSKVTNMADMFDNSYSLASLDVSMLDTRNVTTMNYMFGSMSNLTSLNLSNFVTDKVTDMAYMFTGSSKLTSLNLSGFNTSLVTTMNGMFMSSALTSFDFSIFDTQNLKTSNNMFYSSKFTSLDLSSWDTRNLESVDGMFNTMSSLVNINLSNWDISKVTSYGTIFINTPNRNVICNQGGSPGTGTIFGETCH